MNRARKTGRRRAALGGTLYVPGGYRIWDNHGRRLWGDPYELCPDDLLTELLRRYRAQKR